MVSPKTPTQSPFNIHNFFPPLPLPHPAHAPIPYLSPPSSFPPPPPPHPNAGTQILALITPQNPLSASSSVSAGTHLSGDHVHYDVDAPERPPHQLEVTPITKYGSDPELVIGRQIAVNHHYICYGLKAGAVRVLNLNTASRSLFHGH